MEVKIEIFQSVKGFNQQNIYINYCILQWWLKALKILKLVNKTNIDLPMLSLDGVLQHYEAMLNGARKEWDGRCWCFLFLSF